MVLLLGPCSSSWPIGTGLNTERLHGVEVSWEAGGWIDGVVFPGMGRRGEDGSDREEGSLPDKVDE